MGRVTRAAARADPILADETSTAAESALSDDPAKIALPPSPEKVSDRPPLGEIRVNDQQATAVSDLPTTPEEQTERESGVEAGSSGSDGENKVVLVVGAGDKATAKGEKATVKGKKSIRGTSTGKKSTRNAKVNTGGPSPEVIEQLRQTLVENVKTFKKQGTKNGTKRSGSKKAAKHDETVSLSSASSEAVDMLKEKSSTDAVVADEVGASTPSPAVHAARKQLSNFECEAGTATRLAVVKEPPSPRKLMGLEACSANSGDSNKPRAVQKLAMLFQPQPPSLDKTNSPSPLANIVSQEPTSQSTASKDPIEALDALEEDIEAFERSIHGTEKTQMATKPETASASVKIPSTKKPVTAKAGKPVNTAHNKVKMGAREVQILSPTDSAIIQKHKKRTVEALNTPEKPKKSNKPTTISNFQLSSESTAAKLKAQREERQKRREEQEKMQKEQKPKPAVVRSKPAEVKTTATSRARMSLAAEKSKDLEATGNTATKSGPRRSTTGPRPSTTGFARTPGSAARRPSSLTVKPNGSTPKTQRQNTMARAEGASEKLAVLNTVPRAPRLSTFARSSRPVNSPAEKNCVSATGFRAARASLTMAPFKRASLYPKPRNAPLTPRIAAVLKDSTKTTTTVKGKEVFNREKAEKEERERVAKDKTDAATKARIEAAERGRAASKAWAEKKKKTDEAAKSRSVSSETDQSAASNAEAAQSDENKENEESAAAEKPRNSLSLGVLKNDEIAQDDAAYIVAEMKRIDKVRQSAGGQAVNALA